MAAMTIIKSVRHVMTIFILSTKLFTGEPCGSVKKRERKVSDEQEGSAGGRDFLGILATKILDLPDWLIQIAFGICLAYAFSTAMVVIFVGVPVSVVLGGIAMLIARIFVSWDSALLPGMITAGVVGSLFVLVAIVAIMGALNEGLKEASAPIKPEK